MLEKGSIAKADGYVTKAKLDPSIGSLFTGTLICFDKLPRKQKLTKEQIRPKTTVKQGIAIALFVKLSLFFLYLETNIVAP